jgi:hypothetical protein
MSERDTARPIAPGTGSGGPPASPEPSRAAESEEWAWMVEGDSAFCLEEAGPAPEKRAG